MDPPAKKMKTSPPMLCDMPEDMLAHIASHLEPGDVFNMVLSSKKLFRPAGVVDLTADEDANREEALGFKLVRWSMRHRLKKILSLFTKKKFTFDDLFPEEERNLDFVSGQPQVSFSLLSHQPPAQLRIVILTRGIASQMLIAGSLAVKCAVPRRSGKWRPGDIDIFCTWDAAPMVRRRLFQRCGLICGGVVNNTSYTEDGPYLAGDVEKRAAALIHHVEEYAFSASKVYIPAAVETLAGRTFITPARHALAESFMKALNKVKPKFPDGTCTYDGSEMPKVLAKMKKKVWKGIGLPPYSGSQYDFEHKYTVITRLFERIQKYHRRGVKITNAPDGALDWDIVNLGPNYDSDMYMDDFG